MSKRKDLLRQVKLAENLHRITQPAVDPEDEDSGLEALQNRPIPAFPDTSRLPRLKRFRFQLLHQWLIQTFRPCRAADIGGGKGLLGYLLQESGWQATVVDPHEQGLPDKYKDILSERRIKVPPQASVPQRVQPFESELGAEFDLLIGLHAHGCNVKIIDAAARYGCGFVLFPCCVIDEPLTPLPGVHWLESLAGYAVQQGLSIQTVRLNFKGQNIGLYTGV